MTNPIQIATDYLAAWNTPDETERARLFEGWAEDASYHDPIMTGAGRDGIAAMISGARSQFPGHSFTLASTPDGHGPFVRFAWTLALPGGTPVARGCDVLRLNGAGRIAEVIGFFDEAAA